MRIRTIPMVQFESIEFQTLRRVAPSIRVGFSYPERADKKAWQAWEARWLHGVCSRRDEWDAYAIHGAWDAAVTLEAVLEAQSDRAYWERELQPSQPASVGNPVPAADLAKSYEGGAVGLVAPGTDVCGVLAEARGAQLRDLRNALPILEEAKDRVGPIQKYEHVKYEGS